MRLCIVLIAALLLTSCGGSSGNPTTSQAPSSSPSPATGTSGGAPSATARRPTTVPASGSPLCRAAQLALSFIGQQGATGRGEIGFALRNTSSRRCHTYGYPGVLFLGRGGQPLPTASTRTAHDYFGSAPAVRLLVSPGSIVSFRLGVTHGIVSNVGCTTAYGLQVIAPDDTATLRTTIPQGAYECRTATVSPLRPDGSAYR